MRELPTLRLPGLGRWQRPRLARIVPFGLPPGFALAFLLVLAPLSVLMSGCGSPPAGPPSSPGASSSHALGPLAAGEKRSGRLASGERDVYRLAVTAGEALRLEADQGELDLEMVLTSPAGAELYRWDSPFGQLGPERFCIVLDKAGEYELAVSPWGAVSGRYALHRFPSRKAVERDRLCEAGARRFMAAEQLRGGEGRPEELLAGYGEARTLWHRAGEDFLEGLAFRELGMTSRRLGRLEEARGYFEGAELKFLAAGHQPLAAESLNLLGLAALDLGQISDAEGHFSRALTLSQAAGLGISQAMALNNLGLVAERLGQIHHGADLYQQALTLWVGEDWALDRAQTARNLGRTYLALGYHGAARDLLTGSLEVAQRLRGGEDLAAECRMALGWLELESGRPEQAVRLLEEAVAVWQAEANHPKLNLVGALDRLGTAYRRQGETEKARRAFEQSLAISLSLNLAEAQVGTWTNLALLEESLGRWGAAEANGKKALELAAAAGSTDNELVAWALLARVYHRQGRPSEARQATQTALTRLETLQWEARRTGGSLPARSLWVDTAELAVELSVALFRQSGDEAELVKAFEISERARAREFVGQLQESSLDLASPSLAARQEEERLVERLRVAAQEGDLAELERLDLALTLLRWRHRSADPQFRQILEAEPQAVKRLQGLLDPSTVLLSFEVAEARSWIFRLSRHSLAVFEGPPRAELDALAEMVFEALRSRGREGQGGQARMVATELSRQLLGEALRGVEEEQLLLVGDGWLYSMPWAALPDAASGEPLLDRFAVTTLPSASLLVPLAARAQARSKAVDVPGGALAVVADPVFSQLDPRVHVQEGCAPAVQAEAALPRLEFSAQEALAALAALAAADPKAQSLHRFGFSARRQLLLDGTLSDYRILHLATHAVIDEAVPQRSVLYFSSVDPRGCALDGQLLLSDLHAVRLQADLVVLSACSSAQGKLRRGDGIAGFARGLFNAGASQVLVSLWPVDDEATAQLMGFFYQAHLQQGLGTAAALRQAQQRLRRDPRWQAPYYWAGFQLQGVEARR